MNHPMSRRELIQTVAAMLGGTALSGGDRLMALSFGDEARAQVTANGIGVFSSADVALLDEIADTILPETSTPGAKAAKTGAFMALSATDVYTLENQAIFREGLRKVDEAARSAHGVGFIAATPAQRLAVLHVLDREQQTAMAARRNNDEPRHYFRLMKELALLGYFTSEIGCTKALQYVESPGRYDPCAPFTSGDRAWAGHA
jgi:hypothetical protein